jgi:hypothetical protein
MVMVIIVTTINHKRKGKQRNYFFDMVSLFRIKRLENANDRMRKGWHFKPACEMQDPDKLLIADYQVFAKSLFVGLIYKVLLFELHM